MYLQMAKKLTEDAVRDKARDILGFKDKDGVRSGVGQITTFNQCVINEADEWRGRNVWYPGRSVRYAPKGVTTVQSSAERTEVSRGHSSRKVKDRISRSLEYGWERRND